MGQFIFRKHNFIWVSMKQINKHIQNKQEYEPDAFRAAKLRIFRYSTYATYSKQPENKPIQSLVWIFNRLSLTHYSYDILIFNWMMLHYWNCSFRKFNFRHTSLYKYEIQMYAFLFNVSWKKNNENQLCVFHKKF